MSGHIAALSDNVTRKKVVYKNRYGLDITGELYHAKGMDLTQKHSALIVGAPYGGVKEQGPCIYGNELAQRGFVILTFDQSFMGESGGFTTTSVNWRGHFGQSFWESPKRPR